MKVILVLENVRSVYNVGSIFRTMEGFGFDEIVLVGITPTPLDKKGNKRKDFIKTALGAEDRIRWSYASTNEEVLEQYKDASVWCLERRDESAPLWETLDTKEVAEVAEEDRVILLVIGSEVDGISSFWLDKAHKILHIPMKGEKESFNVTIATGIALYEITKKNTA